MVTPSSSRTSASKPAASVERKKVVTPIGKTSRPLREKTTNQRKKELVIPIRKTAESGKLVARRDRGRKATSFVSRTRQANSSTGVVVKPSDSKTAVTGERRTVRRQTTGGLVNKTVVNTTITQSDNADTDGGRVVISGDNNVYINGDVTGSHHRPDFSTRHLTSLIHIGASHNWYNHGRHYSMRWSRYSCGRVVCFPYHNYYGISYYYPRHHRKYLFVSIGGYWPFSYRYRRYYWYGCHPNYWYGAYPIERETHNTYNTYNYYDDTADTAYDYSADYDSQANYDDFSDVREKLERQKMLEQLKDVPEEESPSDVHFNRAVEAFGNGDFAGAAEEFRAAVILSPDDIILPFTYCQGLFAGGQYAHAASVLRAALSRMPEGNETIYYPRGLYEDEDVLTEQIDSLAEATKTEPFNSDFQLLLGYQLLGMGKVDEAVEPLAKAGKDPANTASAELLMGLVEKVNADKAKEQEIE